MYEYKTTNPIEIAKSYRDFQGDQRGDLFIYCLTWEALNRTMA